MKIPLSLLIACLLVFLPMMPVAQADPIVGILQITESAPNISTLDIIVSNDKAEKKTLRVDAHGNVLTDLRRLKSGDFIAGQGSVDFANGVASIESINSIGLQALIGSWRSATWEIFEFSDFSNLNLYIPRLQQGSIAFSKTRTLTYAVTPGENDGFSIFLTDNNNVRMGFLDVKKDQLSLSITDFNTGKVTQEISLLPLNLK